MKKRTITLICLLIGLLILLLGLVAAWGLLKNGLYYLNASSPAAQTIRAYAKEQGIPFYKYPRDLIELLDTNPETEEFVLAYPRRQELAADVTGYSRDTVPLFLQWDPMWGYETYGSSFLAVTGCGPTCLAMAGYYLTGSPEMNPKAVAEFAEKNGYYAPGSGSSWTLISQGAQQLGLKATELPLVEGKINRALDAGHPVILALGKGDFTSSGHYIVLTARTQEGYTVNDPNSPIRSSQPWTYAQLEGQIRNIWEMEVE